MLLLPLALFVNDITCYGVGAEVTANGVLYTTLPLPAGFALLFPGTDTAKLTVTASVNSSGVDRTPTLTNKGQGSFKFILKSVNQAPGTMAALTVYYTTWTQAIASASSNTNSSATGKGFATFENRKAVATANGFDDDKSISDPTTSVSKLSRRVYYNVQWIDSTFGYRYCILNHDTQALTSIGIAKYTGSSNGNIVQSVGTGNAFHKATFHHAVIGLDGQAGLKFRALGTLSDRNLLVSLTNQFGSPIEEYYSPTDSGWSDIGFDVSSGTYYLTISGQSMLRKKISVTLVAGSLSNIGSVTTYLGDVNGDNIINSSDTSQITNYLGVSSGSSRWDAGDETLSVIGKDCDLNGDGTVNSTDLSIAQANLNVVGD